MNFRIWFIHNLLEKLCIKDNSKLCWPTSSVNSFIMIMKSPVFERSDYAKRTWPGQLGIMIEGRISSKTVVIHAYCILQWDEG